MRASVTLGASFGCPFEGPVPEARVIEHVERMARAGADEILLADTIGVGVPSQVRSLVPAALRAAGGIPIGLHLHNTRNTGYANADAGIEAGATLFDASIGGLGGCPFAPRATGNIATEDLVYLLDGLGRGHGRRPRGAHLGRRVARRGARPRAPGAAVQGRPVRADRLSEP